MVRCRQRHSGLHPAHFFLLFSSASLDLWKLNWRVSSPMYPVWRAPTGRQSKSVPCTASVTAHPAWSFCLERHFQMNRFPSRRVKFNSTASPQLEDGCGKARGTNQSDFHIKPRAASWMCCSDVTHISVPFTAKNTMVNLSLASSSALFRCANECNSATTF